MVDHSEVVKIETVESEKVESFASYFLEQPGSATIRFSHDQQAPVMVCSGFDEELTQRIRTELGELRSFMLEGTVRVAVDDHGNVDVEAATFPVDARLMPLHEAVRKSLIKKTF